VLKVLVRAMPRAARYRNREDSLRNLLWQPPTARYTRRKGGRLIYTGQEILEICLHEVIDAVLKGNDHARKDEAAPLHRPRYLLLLHHLHTSSELVVSQIDMALLLDQAASPHHYSAAMPEAAGPLTLPHRCTSVSQKGSGVPSDGLTHQLPSDTSFTYRASTSGGSFTCVGHVISSASAWTNVCMQSMLIAWT
jgi:hypothetical protein